MGIVRLASRSLENPSISLQDPSAWDDFSGGGPSDSGVRVNERTALTYDAVWRAINLISRDVGKLPTMVYKRDGKGKSRDTDHPAFRLLRWKPNEYMGAFTFKQTLMAHVLLRGNGYAYIFRNADGTPQSLLPLMPDRTYPVRENSRLWYVTTVSLSSGQGQPIQTEQRKLVAEDVLHFRGLGHDGLSGYDVISYARDSIGLGLAARKFGALVFANGAEPALILEHPNRLSAQASKNLRESWGKMHRGIDKSHTVAILEEGMTAKPYSFSAKQAQLLEAREFSLLEVANWFHLPPHKVGHTARTSFSSLEQEQASYLSESLDPWLIGIEEEFIDKLLTEDQKQADTHTVEFLRQALLRSDLTARTSYYVSAIQNSWMSPDEVRALENMNPREDGKGNQYLTPMNMAPSGGDPNAAPGDQTVEPPAVPAKDDTAAGAAVVLDTPAARMLPPPPVQRGDDAPDAKILDVPNVRQKSDFDCGPAATMSVASYFNVGPETEQEYIDALGTTKANGTTPAAIAEYLASLGLHVAAKDDLTIGDLARAVRAGSPIIAAIQAYEDDPEEIPEERSGHYVVVCGADVKTITLQDPSAGRVTMPTIDFLARWEDRDDENEYVHYGIVVSLREANTEARYSDDQARDPTGKWSSGVGAAESKVAAIKDRLLTAKNTKEKVATQKTLTKAQKNLDTAKKIEGIATGAQLAVRTTNQEHIKAVMEKVEAAGKERGGIGVKGLRDVAKAIGVENQAGKSKAQVGLAIREKLASAHESAPARDHQARLEQIKTTEAAVGIKFSDRLINGVIAKGTIVNDPLYKEALHDVSHNGVNAQSGHATYMRNVREGVLRDLTEGKVNADQMKEVLSGISASGHGHLSLDEAKQYLGGGAKPAASQIIPSELKLAPATKGASIGQAARERVVSPKIGSKAKEDYIDRLQKPASDRMAEIKRIEAAGDNKVPYTARVVTALIHDDAVSIPGKGGVGKAEYLNLSAKEAAAAVKEGPKLTTKEESKMKGFYDSVLNRVKYGDITPHDVVRALENVSNTGKGTMHLNEFLAVAGNRKAA
jgi:HK97 family phage portal protein